MTIAPSTSVTRSKNRWTMISILPSLLLAADDGDILIFLPGQEDIEDLRLLLIRYDIPPTSDTQIPNYQQMQEDDGEWQHQRYWKNKKTRFYSTTTSIKSWTVHHNSQFQAAQQAGRAGRVQAGVCFRRIAQFR
jgi:HrpA-like RNA helicase